MEQYRRDKELELEELKLEIKIEKDRFSTEMEEKVAKVETFKKQVKKGEIAMKIIKKIREIMLHKGFLSDREFDMLVEKTEKKYLPLQM